MCSRSSVSGNLSASLRKALGVIAASFVFDAPEIVTRLPENASCPIRSRRCENVTTDHFRVREAAPELTALLCGDASRRALALCRQVRTRKHDEHARRQAKR